MSVGLFTSSIAMAELPTFTVTWLGSLPGGNGQSAPYDVNNAGHVVGSAGHEPNTSTSGPDVGKTDRAFFWAPNQEMENLGTLPGGNVSFAYAINDADQVVGYSTTASGTRAFLWTRASGMEDLGDLPGGADYSVAYDINNLGQVVGASDTATGRHAFLWTREGGMQDLGDLPGGDDSSTAYAIDDSSRVVGQSSGLGPCRSGCNPGQTLSTKNLAFIWTTANGMQQLDTEGEIGSARDITAGGLAVGYKTNDGFLSRALTWQGGVRQSLPLPQVPDDSRVVAEAINSSGEIVGEGSLVIYEDRGWGVLWKDGEGRALSYLIDPLDPLHNTFDNYTSFTTLNTVLHAAKAINDSGQIVARGRSVLDSQPLGGTFVRGTAYLLSPVSNQFTLTAPASVTAGQTFAMNWKVPAGRVGHEGDWVGFYAQGASNWEADPVRWTYTDGITAGQLSITAPTTPGQYEFRYLLDGGYDSVATLSITVTESSGGSTNPSVVLNSPSTATTGQWIALEWNAPEREGHTGDWIGFYHVGDPDTNPDPVRFRYTDGQVTGALWIQAPEPGQYEFRYLTDGEYHSIASSQLTVLP